MTPIAAAGVAEVGKSKILQYTIAGVVAITVIGIIIVVRKPIRAWLETMQIIKTKEEEEEEKGSTQIEKNPKYAPSYWKTLDQKIKDKIKANAATIKRIAQDINTAIWGWNPLYENEEKIIGAVRKISTIAEWSAISDYYMVKYKKDLWSEIKKALYGKATTDEANINRVIRHLTSIPTK